AKQIINLLLLLSDNFYPVISYRRVQKESGELLYTAKQIINLLLLLSDNFYPVISYRRVQKESGELLYTVWSLVMVRESVAGTRVTSYQRVQKESGELLYTVVYGHSLWSANQLPAQEINLNVENFLSQNCNISLVL
ncbi:unnamed protein product, partial [Heterotrigona itama]